MFKVGEIPNWDPDIHGTLYWAKEGMFMYPGLYIWNGRENVLLVTYEDAVSLFQGDVG